MDRVVDVSQLASPASAAPSDVGPDHETGSDRLRWGEVAGLRVGHLDFDARTLVVWEALVRGRRGAIGFGDAKSAAGRRTLAVPVELLGMLGDHLDAKGRARADAEALRFTSPNGSVLRDSKWARRRWYPAPVAAGVGRMVEDDDTGRTR